MQCSAICMAGKCTWEGIGSVGINQFGIYWNLKSKIKIKSNFLNHFKILI